MDSKSPDTQSQPTSIAKSKSTLLTLPTELRQQIYTHAFANLILHPLPTASISHDCTPCYQSATSLPQLYSTHHRSLLTCKQLHAEASPIFHETATLTITNSPTLDRIRKSTRHPRKTLRRLALTIHLTDETRLSWYSSLTKLSTTFPSLTSLTIHNHMRAPNSYDHLIDAIYIAGPLSTLPPHLQVPPALTLDFAYARDEKMFDSPLLGPITTADSREAHESVIRDVMRDEGFRVVSAREGDFDGMTARLLAVARGHEEGWLEGLQRRRLGGFTAREVQQRVARGEVVGMVRRVGGEGGGSPSAEEDSDEEVDENGWRAEDWEEYRRRVGEMEMDGRS